MNESPDTTGCEGMAVRPTTRPHVAMHGTLVAAFPVARATYDPNRVGPMGRDVYSPTFAVELWFATTGEDPAVRQTFHLLCQTGGQAERIAATHRSRWSLPQYGTGPCDVDGIPMAKDYLDSWVPIV